MNGTAHTASTFYQVAQIAGDVTSRIMPEKVHVFCREIRNVPVLPNRPPINQLDFREKSKAKLLLTLLLIRGAFLLSLIVYLRFFLHQGDPNGWKLVLGAFFINMIAAALSLTKNYKYAAALILVEGVIAIPIATARSPSILTISMAPAALTLGLVLCSLVLSVRPCLFALAATIASFFAISLVVPPSLYVSLAGVFLTCMTISILAIVGSKLRDDMERLLEQERGMLFQASKLATLGEMAGGIAHEINTPLAVIQMNAGQISDLLEEEKKNPEVAQKLETISKTVERVDKIVRGLRTFSRDERREPFTEVKIIGILDDTLALCKERFTNRGVRVEVAGADSFQAIMGNQVQLSQVLLNLLNNSYDSVCKEETKWIRIEVRQSLTSIEIHIVDSGAGIPADVRSKLFQPFFTTKDIGRGTGLGLSVSKAIVTSHNGELSLDQTSAQTRFVMKFPRLANQLVA